MFDSAMKALFLSTLLSLAACSATAPLPAEPEQPVDAAEDAQVAELPTAGGPSIECPVVEPVTCPDLAAQPDASGDKPVIGEVEVIEVNPPGIALSARIDTGATTTSVNALNIQTFERDGKKWVRFDLVADDQQVHHLERRLLRTVQIKRHGGESLRRPVVKLQLSLAGVTHAIEVNLTDRSEFEYKLLVGRNFLRDSYVVDVSHRFFHSNGKAR